MKKFAVQLSWAVADFNVACGVGLYQGSPGSRSRYQVSVSGPSICMWEMEAEISRVYNHSPQGVCGPILPHQRLLSGE